MQKKLHERVGRALTEDGFSGLPRRIFRKVFDTVRKEREKLAAEKAAQIKAADAAYQLELHTFNSRIQQLGHEHVNHYYWYHTVELGNGLVTPGDYDYRDVLANYHFPADMRGMTVLDVGSATGFFAFEFEKRGARVISVDLPSLADWDMVGTECARTIANMRLYPDEPLEQVHYRHLEGPFRYCHEALHSKVERCYSRIYDLTPEKLGVKAFDLIFVGDVLGHLFSPLKALDVLASLCGGTLIVSLDVLDPLEKSPQMLYLGGSAVEGDRSWWLPNRACFLQLLDKVGFRSVSIAGEYSCLARRCWLPADRAIYHAKK